MKTLLTTALANSKKLSKMVAIVLQNATPLNYDKAMQSAYDMLNEQKRIDGAISLANATSTIQINGKTITLAEAIKLRKLIPLQNQMLQTLQNIIVSETKQTTNAIAKRQQVLESRTQAFLSKDGQVNPAIMEAIRTQVITEYPDYVSLTLTNCQQQYDKWLAEFSITEEELDTALSVANATIVIEY